MKNLIVITIYFVTSVLNLSAQIPKFSSPVEGNYLKDYYIIQYVDWSLLGYKDYNCGNKSYEGHKGTDFALKSFAQMDSGVYILAAASGTVVEVADSFYDRNKALTVIGAGNYIAIKHTNNYYTYYTHLRKKSTRVKVGDAVTIGQRIGYIGSSGYSSDPQLHFEVWNDSIEYVDPFSGNCGNPTTMWTNQFVYDSVYRIMDKNLIPVIPNIDTLRERYPSKQIFTLKDSVICFWVQESGIKLGDSFSFKWFDPSGKLWNTFSSVYAYNSWYYYNWSYIYFPKTAVSGLWHVKYYHNGIEKLDTPFSVQISNSIEDNKINPIVIQNGKQISINYSSEYQIRFYDIHGKKMYNIDQAQGLMVTNVSEWPTGTYILQFTSKNVFYTKKLIVQ